MQDAGASHYLNRVIEYYIVKKVIIYFFMYLKTWKKITCSNIMIK